MTPTTDLAFDLGPAWAVLPGLAAAASLLLWVRRRAGLVERISGKNGRAKGPALGLFGDGQYSMHSWKMEPGDLIATGTPVSGSTKKIVAICVGIPRCAFDG